MLGRVTNIYKRKSYGYIDADGKEYYFNGKKVKSDLRLGDIVRFTRGRNEKGLLALEVEKAD